MCRFNGSIINGDTDKFATFRRRRALPETETDRFDNQTIVQNVEPFSVGLFLFTHTHITHRYHGYFS